MYLIYALQDPNTKEIRYIGRSTKGLKRPQNHLLPCYYLAKKNKKTPVYRWIAKLARFETAPNIIILQTLDSVKNLNLAEIYWLNYFKENNSPLLNVLFTSSEGSLNYIFSKEQKAKLSKIQRGRKQPTRFKTFMKEYWKKHKGQNSTQEFKEKVSKGTKLWWSTLDSNIKNKIIKNNLLAGEHNRKKIKDSNGNIFSSCTEAAKFYSCSGGMITFCLKNKKALRKTIYFEVINGQSSPS